MATTRMVFVLLGALLLAAYVNGQQCKNQYKFPPKCKNTASTYTCKKLLAAGKCCKLNVFKRCPLQCDPRCNLPGKTRCKDKRPRSVCKRLRKLGKCHKPAVAKNCAKTCGQCGCKNLIPDYKCDLVAEYGWCANKKLYKLCRADCDPNCKPCKNCEDRCEGDKAVQVECKNGKCVDIYREECKDICVGKTAIQRSCEDGECVVDKEEECKDTCEDNKKVLKTCEDGECKIKDVEPCAPVCKDNKLTEKICRTAGLSGPECVDGTVSSCPCGCRDDSSCIPLDQCCKPENCKDECVDDETVQLKGCEGGQCVYGPTEKCEDRCLNKDVVEIRKCVDGGCKTTDVERCRDYCDGDKLVVRECEDGLCVESTKDCKCGCDGDKCLPDDSCCTDDKDCGEPWCDKKTSVLTAYLCEDGECEPEKKTCKCGCNAAGDGCAPDDSCCVDDDECDPPRCDNYELTTFTCEDGDCKEHTEKCRCGCNETNDGCKPDDSCCVDDDECGKSKCRKGTLLSYTCDDGECTPMREDCKCGCSFLGTACKSDDSCCKDDDECGPPQCHKNKLVTYECRKGDCRPATRTHCQCGCNSAGDDCNPDDYC